PPAPSRSSRRTWRWSSRLSATWRPRGSVPARACRHCVPRPRPRWACPDRRGQPVTSAAGGGPRHRERAAWSARSWSVPAVGLEERPGRVRAAVALLDATQTPADLGGGGGSPVVARRGHLLARQRLRDPVRAGGGILRQVVPAALTGPERVQRRHLVHPVAELRQQAATDLPVAGVVRAVG